MSRIVLLVLVSIGAFVACDASRVRAGSVRLGNNPMAVGKLSTRVLDGFFDSVAALAGNYVVKIPIPDVTATMSGVTFKTKDIRITQFAKPQIKYQLEAPSKISGSVEFPNLGISGPFDASRKVGFGPLSKEEKDSGTVVFNASSIHVSFAAILGQHASGAPQVAAFDCKSALGPANLQVKNTQKQFSKDLLSVVAKGIRPGYERLVCPTVKKIIGEQLNRLLSKIPNVLTVNDRLGFMFQIKPQVSPKFISASLFGKVLTEKVSPHLPTKFVEEPSDDALFVVLISDAPFNDVAYQAYANDKLSWTISPNSHPLIYSLVQLKCDPENEACLGNVVPSLAEKYGPDAAVEATFRASKCPEIKFVQGKAVFTGALATDLNITPTNGTQKFHEATADVDISGQFQIKVEKGVLYSKISVDNVTVHIDSEHNKKWEDKIRSTIKNVVEQYVNGDLLLKGVDLHLPFGVNVKDALVKFNPGTLQLQTDIELTAFVEKGDRK